MKRFTMGTCAAALLILYANMALAAGYKATIDVFRQAGASADFFADSYAYAVFPTVGAGAIGIGGAYGKGRVYVHNKFVGTTSMSQISVGLQLGGKTYSQIIFFQDKHALDQFESGKFEFGADASVIAVTSAANAQIGTNGVQTGSSDGQHDAATQGAYQVGMATFIVAKAGLMASASLAGQRFTYAPLDASPGTAEPEPEPEPAAATP